VTCGGAASGGVTGGGAASGGLTGGGAASRGVTGGGAASGGVSAGGDPKPAPSPAPPTPPPPTPAPAPTPREAARARNYRRWTENDALAIQAEAEALLTGPDDGSSLVSTTRPLDPTAALALQADLQAPIPSGLGLADIDRHVIQRLLKPRLL